MSPVVVFALTQVKQSLKLQRTKVVLLLVFLLCIGFYVLVELQYIYRAAESASVGMMAPTYLAATLGPYLLALFCVAMILFSYDLRARDFRSKIDEVLDVVPLSNVAVLSARLCGLVVLIATPMIVFLVLAILYGCIAEMMNIGYGNLVELHSVASFLFWDLVPNLALFGAITIFLSTIIRSRLVVLVLAGVSVTVVFWLFLRLPLDYAGVLVTTTGASIFPSEIAPRFVSGEVLLNRFALTLFASSLVVLAGCCWYRPLVHRQRYLIVGLISLGLSVLAIGVGLGSKHLSRMEVQDWVRTHDALELSTFPDVTNIKGSVDIYPGRTLELDLTFDLISPENNIQDFVVLSLNPGYHLVELSVGGMVVADPHFEQGVLRVPLPTREAEVFDVSIKAQGRPDKRFAYLDAAVQSRDIAGAKIRNLFALGTESYIWHRDFVVLTSGIKWYPTSGSAIGEDQIEVRPRDLFNIDLTVSVPKDWWVGGGGHRNLVESQESRRSTYQIAPRSPLPEVTLVSSDFERASMEVEGIEFEVLFTKHHRRRFQELSALERSTKARILNMLRPYKDEGLIYPYELFSLVEVPNSLRVYGGGWRLDTIMGSPGMVFMRESSLPNTKIPIQTEINYDKMTEQFGPEVRNMSGSVLSTYFRSNIFGEHPTIGFARNFVKYQTSTTGDGALVLDYVMEDLVQRLVFGNISFHSIFVGDHIGSGPGRFFIFEVATSLAKRSVMDLFDFGTDKPTTSREELALLRYSTHADVWSELERFSLGANTTDQAPLRSFKLLSARSTVLSRTVYEILGRNSIATILGQTANSAKGRPHDYFDMVREANRLDLDLEAVLGDWLNISGLPGFFVAEPSARRLPDNEHGKEYEASVILHNSSPVDGFVDVSFTSKVAGGSGFRREDTREWFKAFLVRGKESVLLSVRSGYRWPVQVLYIEPYLSLNRDAIRVDIPPVADESKISETPQPYVVSVSWAPPVSKSVVVDDLDDSFEIVYEDPPLSSTRAFTFLQRIFGSSQDEIWDRGLPVYVYEEGQPPPKQRWLRRVDSRAYGMYRHSYALIHHGRESKPTYAKYRATLPETGRWQLEYHMPIEEISKDDREYINLLYQGLPTDWYQKFSPGQTHIRVLIGEQEEVIEFDAESASYGWQALEQFEVESTETEVRIYGASEQKTVYADAIRWVPLDGQL